MKGEVVEFWPEGIGGYGESLHVSARGMEASNPRAVRFRSLCSVEVDPRHWSNPCLWVDHDAEPLVVSMTERLPRKIRKRLCPWCLHLGRKAARENGYDTPDPRWSLWI